MKKGEQPEFSAKWWKGSQPKGLKSASKLEDALGAYESAAKKLEQSGDAEMAKAARDALGAIEPAVKAVIAEASKAKNAPEMDFTVESLKKFDRLYAPEQAWIEEHAKEEEDDESVFANPDAYHDYLTAGLKKLRSGGQMNFGMVLGKKAEDHRLAVHRSKGAKALANTLVKQTSLHAMTFGIAVPDENRAGVLVLALEGRQLPGMSKKGARMLKKFKPLPFTKLAIMVDGVEVEDLDDPEDTDVDEPDDAQTGDAPVLDAAALTRELGGLIRRVAAITDADLKTRLGQRATEANTALKGNNLPAAATGIAALKQALDGAGGGAGNGAGAGNTVAYAQARLRWLRARQQIESDIDKLGNEIVTTYQNDGIAPELEKLFRERVSPILATLDESLADKLDEVTNAADPAERARLVGEARAIMQRYAAYVGREKMIADLDGNPFVPLTIRQTILTTIADLSKTVQARGGAEAMA